MITTRPKPHPEEPHKHYYDCDGDGIGGVVVVTYIEDMPGYLFTAYSWRYGSRWLSHSVITGLN